MEASMRHELKVNRSELVEGLTKIGKLVKRKTKSDALLNLEDGNLVVLLDGISIKASAEGNFPGLVRIPGSKALTLIKVLPSEDSLTIAHDGERLYVENFSISCTWLDGEPTTIQVPADASVAHLLGVSLKHSEQEISTSGLSGAVHDAQSKRAKLERQAAHVLEPLGVTLSDIQELVERSLRQAVGLSPSSGHSHRPTFEELAAQALESHRMLHAEGKCRSGSEQHRRFMKKMESWM
jgi:hypothetical protein